RKSDWPHAPPCACPACRRGDRIEHHCARRLLRCMSPELAQSCRGLLIHLGLLLGGKRTCASNPPASAYNPFRSSAQPKSRIATGAQRAPEWHLAVRPSARDAPSPAARRSCRISKGLHISTKIFRRYPQSGLTAPNGGIRSASSIGTVVCSSAVVVGQRIRKGRSMMGQARQCTCAEGQRTGRSIDRAEPCHGWLLMRWTS